MTVSTQPSQPVQTPVAKEKIIFEIKSMLLPTILNMETLATIGFVALAAMASVVFRFGIYEIVIVALVFLLLAVPAFRAIFMAGSTTYVLTNQRLMIFTVGLGKKERAVALEQIQSITCKQSGLQRLYGAGEILIRQKGLRGSVRMVGLSDCKQRAEQIRKAAIKAGAAVK